MDVIFNKSKVNIKNKEFISPLIQILIYFIIIYIISANVMLNGDDYMYGNFASHGLLQSNINYYFTGNGRFIINILDSFIIGIGSWIYPILITVNVMVFTWMIGANIGAIKNKELSLKEELIYFRIAIVLFTALSPLCKRETVFWITGMLNYLFPANLFLVSSCFLIRLSNRDSSKVSFKIKFIYYVLCFITSFSVEQYSLMFIGVEFLTIVINLAKKTTVNKIMITGFIISIAGFLPMFLAPGNFVRIHNQSQINVSLFDNLWTLIVQDTLSDVAWPYLEGLAIIFAFISCQRKKESKLFRICTYLLPLILYFVRIIPQLERMFIYCSVILMFIFVFLYCLLNVDKRYLKWLGIFVFVGFGSQIMLLISVIHGYRCMFSLYLVYMLLIEYFITDITTDTRLFILTNILLSTIEPRLIIIIWLIYFIYLKQGIKLCWILKSILIIGVLIDGCRYIWILYQRVGYKRKYQ